MSEMTGSSLIERKDFSKIPRHLDIPDLIEIQKRSYDSFLQMEVDPDRREDKGLQAALTSVFPIADYNSTAVLEFVNYSLGTPKYDVRECMEQGMSYAAPLKVRVRLVVLDKEDKSPTKKVLDVREQEVYIGELPLMTERGTFIINGTERVVVSQLHRSPGAFFTHDKGRTHASGKVLFSARIIPYRGSWLDFEFVTRDILYGRIDRRRKMPATILLKAFGYTTDDLLRMYYPVEEIHVQKGKLWRKLGGDIHAGRRVPDDLVEKGGKEHIARESSKLTRATISRLKAAGIKEIEVNPEDLVGRTVLVDLVDIATKEKTLEKNHKLTAEVLKKVLASKIDSFKVVFHDSATTASVIEDTLESEKTTSKEEAMVEIYKRLRPGETPSIETARALFENLFFNSKRYDLSPVGRLKLNKKQGLDLPLEKRTLTPEDIVEVVRYIVHLKAGKGEVDDIDHLGNRRVRSVGELLENHFRLGLVRMERSIRERMNLLDMEAVLPHDLINAKPVIAAIKEFFASSQLSQFMDQTNPLAEITHKRRLSALGPGGLTRERAGFEVRDVHPTHYGRICPIETPEGPNIGLVISLATYAHVNQYGFIESAYRRVVDGRVTDEVVYLSAMDEGRYAIAQANVETDAEGRITADLTNCRKGGDFVMQRPQDIDLIDVSPKQLVSVAAALIPFLENDDANRALMGSNMQRQAVPLIQAEAPLVGTGMEETVARDSGVTIIARRSGIVDQVDATRIVVRATEETSTAASGVDIYNLLKFQRSNQNTCITQRPLVKVGDSVMAGNIIADGPSTQLGELALGRNVLCAFMPWNGYNFEDSILISERIVRGDGFTSIHIEKFEVMARDTKLGQEEITRDIPNVGEEALKNLDEAGIVYIGAEVKPGDILVGKVTPKGESPMTPEEKLLRATFGEKASDVRDTSLRVPPGVSGTIVEVRVFSRRGVDKDERALAIERAEIERLAKDRDDERSILERSFAARLKELMLGEIAVGGPRGMKSGTEITEAVLAEYAPAQWKQISIRDDARMADIEGLRKQMEDAVTGLTSRFESKVEKLQRGDELPPGVMKMVKVFVAVKRKLQPGDKMAGRHGNKGVISRIVPSEDMPYLEDGTPVDIVLNPLGVPSRMNVGQILETHLGWAAAGLGRRIGEVLANVKRGVADGELGGFLGEMYHGEEKAEIDRLGSDDLLELAGNLSHGVPMASPVFDGARAEDIVTMLERAGLASSGQVILVDGRTGEPFDRKVTVGYIYMLKLHHLVDDKIHARSIGPYSLVTQQPLGGKAQFGGQRFGEMEVWALEAYGAAYTLQEMLTVKSDDVAGRTKVYEAIVRGDDTFEAGIPESFNVLVKEMRSLGLNVDLHNSKVGPGTTSEAAE